MQRNEMRGAAQTLPPPWATAHIGPLVDWTIGQAQ